MKNLKRYQTDPAVSPVVAVLLMLVVTIIIAAVVSGFAGGLVENKEKTPQTSIDVSYTKGEYEDTMVIKHLGGDSLNTKNVQLITTWTNATGVANYQKTVAPIYDPDTEYAYHGSSTSHYTLDSLNTDYYGAQYNEPYLVIPGDMPADDTGKETELWWGNFIMKAGDVAKVMGALDHSNSPPKPVVKNFEYLTANDLLTVKLIDSTTGGTIYEKNIDVKE